MKNINRLLGLSVAMLVSHTAFAENIEDRWVEVKQFAPTNFDNKAKVKVFGLEEVEINFNLENDTVTEVPGSRDYRVYITDPNQEKTWLRWLAENTSKMMGSYAIGFVTAPIAGPLGTLVAGTGAEILMDKIASYITFNSYKDYLTFCAFRGEVVHKAGNLGGKLGEYLGYNPGIVAKGVFSGIGYVGKSLWGIGSWGYNKLSQPKKTKAPVQELNVEDFEIVEILPENKGEEIKEDLEILIGQMNETSKQTIENVNKISEEITDKVTSVSSKVAELIMNI